MMMKTQWIKAASVFLLAGIMAAGMDAQPRRGGGYGGYGRYQGSGNFDGYGPGNRAAWSQLDLTDEQEAALTELRLEHYKEMQPLRSQMIELKAKERALLLEDEVDMKALNSVIDDQTDLNNRIRKQRAEHRVSVRSLLTDEQRMIADQRRSFRNDRWGRGHGAQRGFQGRRGGYGRWGEGYGGRGLGPCGQGMGPGGW